MSLIRTRAHAGTLLFYFAAPPYGRGNKFDKYVGRGCMFKMEGVRVKENEKQRKNKLFSVNITQTYYCRFE